MEQILQQILDKLQVVENSQLDMRKDIHDIKTEQAEMKAEQTEMRKELGGLKAEQTETRKELGGLKEEQAEMRKEVAFYYGTMMKKLDEVKTELSSEIKHISSVQKQHQHVHEIINEKQ
ncbi:hypothetical protein ACVBAX_09095 [Robertmurraya sp. GLU-23]